MSTEEPTTWESYEDVARYLLEQLGDKLGLKLERVEGKQKLVGKSGMEWEIEGKGVKTDDGGIVVIECRRYTTSKVKAEAIGALAYRMSDLGASGGIVVTPIGVQHGGQLVAKAEGIQIVQLDADSSTTSFLLRFLGNVVVGPAPAKLTLTGGVPDVRVAPAKTTE
jgi:Restriction endonuclease